MIIRIYIGLLFALLICLTQTAPLLAKSKTNIIHINKSCELIIENDANEFMTNSILKCDWIEMPSLYDFSVELLWKGDLDKDGVMEIIVQGYSGGAHCCSTYAFYSLRNPILGTFVNLGNVFIETKNIKDLDGDSIPEIIIGDDSLSYFESMSFAGSPFIKLAINYQHGQLKLKKNLLKSLNKDVLKQPLKPTKVELDGKNLLFPDEMAASVVLTRFMLDLYMGNAGRSLGVLDKYFIAPNKVKKILYKRVISRLKDSLFWPDIKRANGL